MVFQQYIPNNSHPPSTEAPPPEEASSPESSPENLPPLDLLHVSDNTARAGDSDVSNEEEVDKTSQDKNR